MRHFLFAFSLLLLAALVLYYSWIPTPSFKQETYMPLWLIWFTDVYDNVRTAVPMLAMGFLAGNWLLIAKAKRQLYAWAWAGMILLVVVAELGQLGLPRRSFDWADIAWGTLGAAVGLAIAIVLKLLFKNNL